MGDKPALPPNRPDKPGEQRPAQPFQRPGPGRPAGPEIPPKPDGPKVS